MPPYPNLISDSILISETIELLQSFGGRASAVKVVDYVMKISAPEPDLAKTLVSDLIEIDPRLHLNDDTVELIDIDFERRDFQETDFVVFDLETTGAKTPPCRVTEIGAYRVRGGKIIEEFQTLINPETTVPTFISELTGITNRMVRNAPRFSEVIEPFLDFVSDSVLVAHNAQFDMRFLNHEVSRVHDECRVANPHLCTVKMSRKLLPHVPNHRLKTLAEHFSVPLVNHHRAAPDAYATAHIFVNLLERLQSLGVKNLAGVRKFRF